MPMPPIPDGDDPAAAPVLTTQPSMKPLHIRCEDGSILEVEKMDLPRNLKHVLREMDLDNSGIVDEKNFEDSLKILRHLRRGLDTDGSGHVTNQEMEDGVQLLSKLMEEKAKNSSEMPYKHLPEQIQDVMREWDADGSGMVGVAELSAAAGAYKKIQQEGRLMKKIIIGMAIVILFLMVSMFVLSYLAVDMAKEMRGSSDGTMESSSGVVVKVGSSDFEMAADGSLIIRGVASNASCPANTTCRRLQASNNVISTAVKETPRQLSSTLPDASFKELKQLTLKDNNDHSLKVIITSFQRLSLKSSKCGSVIHLMTDQGRLTLDDYEMTADATLEAFIKDAGMEGLFQGGLSGFGRRLSSTDGMLEGFFNMLEDVEWACESVSLPSPNDIPQYYHAKIHVKHLHNRPAKAYSKYFKDEEGNYLLLPGIIKENDKIYKTWKEELVKSAGVTAYLSEYALHPLQRELRLKKGGVQATVQAMGRTGYRCFLESPEASSMQAAANSGAVPTMEFRGVVVEGGVVLRQWRLDPMGDLNESDEGSENTISMMEAGMIPNVVDYYDVDTDPTGKFEPGQPYRIHMYSNVAGSKVDTVKQYLSIEPLPAVFEVPGILEYFNVTKLDGNCSYDRELQKGKNGTSAASSSAYQKAKLLAEEVKASVGVANRSAWDVNFKMPPEIMPWTELPSTVNFTFRKLEFYLARRQSAAELAYARSFNYWEAMFTSADNKDELDSYGFGGTGVDPMDNSTDPYQSVIGGRRLQARHRGTRIDHDDGTYTVEITEDDLKPADPDHPLRRLSASGRRLDDNEPGWKYKAWVTPERIEIEAEVGKATLTFLVQYCNVYNPTATNWGACQTGRAGAGDIVKLEAYCSGKQIFWPFPKVSMELGGLLVYDDTSAMGIKFGHNFYLSNRESRGRVLGMDGWNYRWYDKGAGGSARDAWQIISADGGITQIGTDGRVFIKNMNTGRHIQDNKGNVRMSSNTGGWEKFHVLDAGGGSVYLKSHRGQYLAIREDQNWGPGLECKVTLYKNKRCSGGTRVVRTTSTAGYTDANYGRRRRRRRYIYITDEWRSAKGEGYCSQVEFFDEDEGETMYEDNLWQSGNFNCFTFDDADGGSDVDEDLGGVKIWAEGYPPPAFGSNGQVDLVMTWEKDSRAKWIMTKADDGGSLVSFGDALLYGGLTFSKEIEIIWGIKASWTTEIGAAGAIHDVHGVYLAEVYGKTIFEITPVQIYLLLKFNPDDPWDTNYKKWKMYVGVGYELDTWLYTFRDEYEITSSELDFS
eukprot:symbB.v1.2.012879.t1/scaffold876.1/size155678/4